MEAGEAGRCDMKMPRKDLTSVVHVGNQTQEGRQVIPARPTELLETLGGCAECFASSPSWNPGDQQRRLSLSPPYGGRAGGLGD